MFKRANALELLKESCRRGLVSTQTHGIWPQNLWAVTQDGYPVEAQLENSELGIYHGYPMPDSLSLDERHTRCELSLLVNGHHYFRNEDLLNKHKVNNFSYLSASPLAEWFVVNWWRLLCEAPKSNNIKSEHIDWLMSHKLGAAGAGYCWPDLTICSDGESVQLILEASTDAKGPLRYLDTRSDWVAISDYESELTNFISHVIARLEQKKVADSDLNALWDELTVERNTPELTAKRRLEAIMGFDPDEAPQTVISELVSANREHGPSSVEELTQALECKTPEFLASLNGKLKAEFTLPKVASDIALPTQGTPWQRGDAITTPAPERLLPCTDLKTSRQKFQRAFAQEFLCPYQDLIEHLNTDTPNEEQQELAARHFQVSPMMISRIFQNHGQVNEV